MQRKIQKLLIANRGEIASRIIHTCKKLNIQTIAIYSNPDADKPFVREADKSFSLQGYEAKDTYLNIPKILEIAKQENVNAIHPGYGFLSENSEFAQKVLDSGIIFIGPSPRAIQQMGDKIIAKKLMRELGVPVIPGYEGENQESSYLLEIAKQIGFPIMIKASAGGGGKGMRRVENENDFLLHLESAKREAKNFFMNDHVFLEKFISSPRHIEVQVFGDKHGNYIHLFERDCSVQRRNQKVIEEAPALFLSHNVRKKMYESALKAVKGIQYENAGTVEFIVDENENFYFLEMNTRLQVEHPVTERITGLDLVELQIRVAEGEQLPPQETIRAYGHSIELRVYAEENEIPSSGKIYNMNLYSGKDVRLDSGVDIGVNISTYYDSMLLKFIGFSGNRKSCIEELISHLNSVYIHGIPNNLYYLKRILEHPEFKKGKVTTKFIEEYITPEYIVEPYDIELVILEAHLILGQTKVSNTKYIFNDFRIWEDKIRIEEKFTEHYYHKIPSRGFYHCNGNNFLVEQTSSLCPLKFRVTNLKTKTFKEFPIYYDLEKPINHYSSEWKFTQVGHKIFISKEGKSYLVESISLSQKVSAEGEGAFKSPMPGKVISILTREGELVKEGKPILIIEAMKMENTILATEDLIIEKIFVKVGDLVTPETRLIQIKSYSDA